MSIRIVRNEAGNCINFYGSSNPTYWNSCLSGEVDTTVTNAINVINDIITSETGVTQYEFFKIPYTEFVDAEGNSFASAQETADYITEKANVIGLSGEGISLANKTVCFDLDATSTSIMLDNGYSFGVNTIKAIDVGGLINIVSNDDNGDITHFYELDPVNTCVNGNAVSGGLNDVINTLNELFTVGAFESVVITDPYSTMVADVSGVDTSATYVGYGIDPIGNDVYGSTSTNSQNGYKTVETIDQAGEYFTFDIRVEGTIGFGLVHSQASYDDGYWSGNSNYADPTRFGIDNSAHYGFQFSHWFHPTPNGSWTNYGANTSYSMRAGWSNFNGTAEQSDWLAGNPIKVRVGIDTNGYISIETLRNGTDWVVHARTSYPIVDGAEFHLGIKTNHTGARVHTLPKVHLLEPAAPTMYFRYAESPDGVFKSPLFATSEEAEYYDTVEGGSGTYTTLMLPDDPTNTVWYIPDTEYTGNGIAAPVGVTFEGNLVNYTEITTLTNADLIPPAFTDAALTIDELASINYPTQPQDTAYTTTFSGLEGVLDSIISSVGGTLSGTAPEVTGDNVANPSDTYTIGVHRTNSYGTSNGTLTLNVTNLTAPVITAITGFTHNASSTALVDSDTMDSGSVVDMDESLLDLERLVILDSFVETNVLPSLQQAGDKYYMGVLNSGADISSVEDADWDVAFLWEYQTSTTHQYKVIKDGVQQHQTGIGSRTVALFDYAIEVNNNNLYMIACNQNSINTEPSPAHSGSFSNATQVALGETKPLTISLAYVGSASADFSETDLSEIVTPAPDDWIQVTASPSHTLQFDGSGAMPTLQAGYTYRFLIGDTVYADLSSSTGLHVDDDLRFTADGTTEYTTGITRVGNPNDLGTFGAHTAYVEFVVPSDVPPLQWYTDHNGIGSATGLTISGSSYVAPVTGVGIEGPVANFTGNVINIGSKGWISLNEQLSAGERLVLDSAFLEDLNTALPDYCIFWVGLKDSAWANTGTPTLAFKGGTALRFYNTSTTEPGLRFLGYANGGTTNQLYSASLSNASAFIEISNTGNNIRVGYEAGSTYNASSTSYTDWDSNTKIQTGDQGYGITSLDVVIYWQAIGGNAVGFDISDIDWTGLSEINVPTLAPTSVTNWTKALDFSGSNEHAKQVSSNVNYNPLRMNGLATQIAVNADSGKTSSSTNARPWATAIVFKADRHSSNQHIWNSGEGTVTNDDNIYLRLSATGDLFFGWGREGVGKNECRIAQSISSSTWYGVYIAHKGYRASAAAATSSNLPLGFDIRLMSSADSFNAVGSNLSVSGNWTSTGARMDRAVSGDFTIGGRGSNRNFHGKVASMIITTLRVNQNVPTDAEIKLMITDPKKWEDDYRDGQLARGYNTHVDSIYNPNSWQGAGYTSNYIWLMGDGTGDTYFNHIRNQVLWTDQNVGKLQLNSMVSNDIENVTIPGLS